MDYSEFVHKTFRCDQLNWFYYNEKFLSDTNKDWQSYSNLCFSIDGIAMVNIKCDDLSPREFIEQKKDHLFYISDEIVEVDGFLDDVAIINLETRRVVKGKNIKTIIIAYSYTDFLKEKDRI